MWFKKAKESDKWTNWGRNQSSTPRQMWYPQNFAELQKIVQDASYQGFNVHAYGAGHSWSNLVPTSGYLINTRHLNAFLGVDLEKKQIHVEAGMPLYQLNSVLDEHGLALSNLGRVTEQSITGATATGTHGTGHTPTLASFITEVELLSPEGQKLTISAEQLAHYLPAARLSLGVLGIIYALKLQCEPAFVLESRCTITPFQETFDNYEKLRQEHDYWMFEWNPYTEKALVYAWDRTALPPTNNSWGRVMAGIKEATLNTLTVLSKPFPHFAPTLIDMRFRFSAHSALRAKSYKVFTRPYLGMRYVECEMSIKHEFLPQVVQELKTLFKEYQEQGIYVPRVTFRFVEEEKETLLSPTFDGKRVFISLVMLADAPFALVFPDYQARMAQFNARPHWGKVHRMNSELAHHLYGDNMKTFLKIREELDPKGLFLNEQIKSIIA